MRLEHCQAKWAPVRVKKMRKKEREKHFQAKHAPAKAGVGTGSRQENAKKQRER